MKKKQVVPKGKQYTRTHQRFWGIYRTVPFQRVDIVLSGPGLIYDHLNSDQYDWNKLPFGIYLDPYRPHGRTQMGGWRYNLDTGKIEVCHYYHNPKNLKDYKAVNPGASNPGYIRKDTLILEVPIIRDTAMISMLRWITPANDGVRTQYVNYYGDKIDDTALFDNIGSYHTRGNLFFGGNRKTDGKLIANLKW